jgi:hypothetical protein
MRRPLVCPIQADVVLGLCREIWAVVRWLRRSSEERETFDYVISSGIRQVAEMPTHADYVYRRCSFSRVRVDIFHTLPMCTALHELAFVEILKMCYIR